MTVDYGFTEKTPTKFLTFSSLTARPDAASFGVGACLAEGVIYESDGATWTALSEASLPVTVAQGGTGTTTAFTAGSIVFAGASGVYTQDNTSLFFDNTNNRVGLATAAPSYDVSFGTQAARTISVQRHATADTAGIGITLQAGSATLAATDKAGGDVSIKPGVSTGTGESGVQLFGSVAGSTGTTDNAVSAQIQVLGNKIGLFGVTPVVRPTALTTQLTAITHTAPTTPDYALQDLVQNTGFGFATADEGNTALSVIANLQARVAELETKLQALGVLT